MLGKIFLSFLRKQNFWKRAKNHGNPMARRFRECDKSSGGGELIKLQRCVDNPCRLEPCPIENLAITITCHTQS